MLRELKFQKKDRKVYDKEENYKALPLEIRGKFISALNEDKANFIKPLCFCIMFTGLHIDESIALNWKNFDEQNKKMNGR